MVKKNFFLWVLIMATVFPQAWANDFDVYSEGIVTDKLSGLMWMRCSVGQVWDGGTCTGEAAKLSWHEAMKTGKDFHFAGMSDWRVPRIEELNSLVYCSSGKRAAFKKNNSGEFYDGPCMGDFQMPTINQEIFPNTPVACWYWSSSSAAYVAYRAWGLHFAAGVVGNSFKDAIWGSWTERRTTGRDCYVRLVRDVQ